MQDMWDMRDMCQYARYVPIYTDMGDFLQGMSTHIDMKKLAEKFSDYSRISWISLILCASHTIKENIASYRHHIDCTYIWHGTWSHTHISRAEQYTDISTCFFRLAIYRYSTQISTISPICNNTRQISSQICISTFLHLRRHIATTSICALDVVYMW